MQVCVLGPLAVTAADGANVPVPGRLVRRLLVRLAVAAPAQVGVGALVSAIWPDGTEPGDATNALQSLVSRLRRALGRAELVKGGPGGYALDLPADAVDAHRVHALAARGRQELVAGRLSAAAVTLGQARDLFRGDPLAEVEDGDWARGEIARLADLRLDVTADLLDVELRSGRGAAVVGDLDRLVADHPLREDFTRQLVTALAAAGRVPEALAAYERLRVRLADELGIDPGPELRALHLDLLRGDTAPPPGPVQTNLRSFLTTFVGRTAELDRLSRLLADHRLVTIVGPGGAGKTRLAVHTAERAAPTPRDGVWLVELAAVTSGENVAAAIVDVLGLVGGPLTKRLTDARLGALAPAERVVDLLASSDVLLVLDNCEHLLEASAALVDEVLARCPDVRILATSREPLGILGEALCSVPPLGLPPEEVTPANALTYPAVALLADRAAATTDFAVTEANVAAVVTVVRRLDGLPLAIELAAARLRVLSVETVAQRLSDRFRLLAGGNRVALPRHRTLRAVVEWSWDLLTEPERLLAERLAVFPAGATTTSATAICADDRVPPADVPDLLLSLADKSLLQVVDVPGEPRFRMLETIREYGIERLDERDEADAARLAHAEWFARLAVELDPVLRTREQLAAVAVLKAERENLQAALRYLGDSGRAAEAIGLTLALSWYWTMLEIAGEAVPWLDYTLTVTAGSDDPRRKLLQAVRVVQTLSLDNDAYVHEPWDGDSFDRWRLDLSVALDGLDEVVDVLGGTTLYELMRTVLAYFSSDVDRGNRLVEALTGADQWTRAAALALKAGFAENVGRLDLMRPAVETAYRIFTEIGDRWGVTSVLESRAHLRTQDGDLEGALSDIQEALAAAHELGSDSERMFLLIGMVDLHLRLGQPERAMAHLQVAGESRDGRPLSHTRELLLRAATAGVLHAVGQTQRALAIVLDLRDQTRAVIGGPAVFGHLAAMVYAVAAQVETANGILDLAREDLADAYRLAIPTQDAPIVAMAGVAVALYAAAVGQSELAATILGAAAGVRGSADHTDPRVSSLTARLGEQLGERFARCYDDGRALDFAAATAFLDPAGLIGPAPAAATG